MNLDCNIGEGGGQVLRTSLSLACVLGKELTLKNIRSKRPKPGLQAQHLACVNALQQISNAEVSGASLGSTTLSFKPRKASGGEYVFDIGTAGSVVLLAQCVIPVLAFSEKPSKIKIIGGTDTFFAPTFDYFSEVFCPTVKKMGLEIKAKLLKRGYYPKGGGEVDITVKPVKYLKPINLLERGQLKKVYCNSIAGNLSETIANRQAATVKTVIQKNAIKEYQQKVWTEQTTCPGTTVFIKAEYENAVAGFTSLGKIGRKAEEVAEEAALSFTAFNTQQYTVDEHLADQLMIYASLAKGTTKYKGKNTSHASTNADVLRIMTGCESIVEDANCEITGITHQTEE